MTRSFSNTFVPQLVAGFLQIQKEEFDGANRHFDKMLCLPRNHHDEEIIWFAKAHIYKKLGNRQKSHDCLKMALNSFDYAHLLIGSRIDIP